MKWLLLLAIPAAAGTGLVLSRDADFAGRLPWSAQRNEAPTAVAQDHADSAETSRRVIFANGVVEGKHRGVELNFEIEGQLAAMEVRDGQPVVAGQVLARLASDVWQAKLEAAQAELSLAEARRQRLVNAASREARDVAMARVKVAEVRVEQTARDFDRGFELRKQGGITPQQWDDIQYRHSTALAEVALARAQAAEVAAAARSDDLQVADAQIAVARAAAREAHVMLQKSMLRAPADGIVLRVDAEPGELISPDRPLPVITLSNTDEIRVRAYVEELDALSLAVGSRASVTADARPEHRYFGVVVECGPSMHPKHVFRNKPGERVDVKVREIVIRLRDADELVVGLPVDVFIERTGHEPVPGAASAPRDQEDSSLRRFTQLSAERSTPRTTPGPGGTERATPDAFDSPQRHSVSEANR